MENNCVCYRNFRRETDSFSSALTERIAPNSMAAIARAGCLEFLRTLVVGVVGIEPTRPCGRGILSPLCLPISPYPRSCSRRHAARRCAGRTVLVIAFAAAMPARAAGKGTHYSSDLRRIICFFLRKFLNFSCGRRRARLLPRLPSTDSIPSCSRVPFPADKLS